MDDLIRALGVPGVHWAVRACAEAHPVSKQEAALVAGAAPVRQAEFRAGRAAAHAALSAAGTRVEALLADARRAPLWPSGYCGSIAHDRSDAVVAVAAQERFRSLGIDLEADAPLEDTLLASLTTPAERDALEELPTELRGSRLRRLFSAKEAAYKWQYPLCGAFPEFEDLALEWDADGRSFRGRFLRTAAAELGPLVGRWAADGVRLLTFAAATDEF